MESWKSTFPDGGKGLYLRCLIQGLNQSCNYHEADMTTNHRLLAGRSPITRHQQKEKQKQDSGGQGVGILDAEWEDGSSSWSSFKGINTLDRS